MSRLKIQMPIGIDAYKLCRSRGDVLELCLPLSPSKNVWMRSHWSARQRYGKQVYEYAWLYSRILRLREPWAHCATVDLVRCSKNSIMADQANIVSGVEKHLDALHVCGFLPDDSPEHMKLGAIEERMKARWEEYYGPATWLRLTRTI